MGLFGFVKKIGGKILKTGLSVATRGVSDKVLAGIKALNMQKKKKAMQTRGMEAIALRHAPTTKTTTTYARRVLDEATRGGGSAGDTRTRTDIDGSTLPGSRESVRRPRARRRAKPRGAPRPAPAAKRSAGPKPRATKPAAPRARRTAPAHFAKFAEQAKRLAGEWRAAGGKEGTGQSFFEWKAGKK